MTQVCFYVETPYLSNKIFDLTSSKLNRDGTLYPFNLLKQQLERSGISIATQDIIPPESADLILCNDMPPSQLFPRIRRDIPLILLLFETATIKPMNWNLEFHRYFDRIYTWNDDFIDDVKYFKFQFPQTLPNDVEEISRIPKIKNFVMIAGNKTSQNELELYSERLRTIQWFEDYYPDSFDLFGIGWDMKTFKGPLLIRGLNRIKPLRKLVAPPRPSFRGSVIDKRTVLKNYKFSICYENVKNTQGYITEKIFDCLFSGSIPIYWGPPNASNWIPEGCYIRREDFSDHQSMYAYASGLSDKQRATYIESALNFVNGSAMIPFLASTFAERISAAVLSELPRTRHRIGHRNASS